MSVQFSDDVRNARAAAIEATVGASPTLEFRTEAKPANCAAADVGIAVATVALPADWLSAPAAGVISKVGVWVATALAAGAIGHYRIKQGATCHEQGTVTISGGGGDITIDNPVTEIGQVITVTGFTKTEPHA